MRERDVLYSFMGADTAGVRSRIARLRGGDVRLRPRWHFECGPTQRDFERREFIEMMARSRFTLCPRGTGPSSLRVWEALASGSVPVIIADELRLPLGIDWATCSIRVREGEVDSIPDLLASIPPEGYERLASGARKARGILDDDFAFPVEPSLARERFKAMMTGEEIRLIEKFLSPRHNCLEWGAGGSSLRFSALVQRLITIEHDRDWFERIRNHLPEGDLILVEVDHRSGAGDPAAFENYIRAPSDLGLRFDRILIDGRCREACALEVLRSNLLAPGGVVFIHDWVRSATTPSCPITTCSPR